MNFDRVFEIELSSLCNAKCSGCMRTMLDDKGIDYYKGNISYDEIVKWFKPQDLSETKIKLCGVLGDPIVNPELEDILDYLLYQKQVKNIEISTNAGLVGGLKLHLHVYFLSISARCVVLLGGDPNAIHNF